MFLPIWHWPSRQLTCFLSYSSPLWVILIHTCTHLRNRGSLINLWHFALTQATNLAVSSGCLPRLPLTISPPPTIRCSIPDSWNICISQIRLFFSPDFGKHNSFVRQFLSFHCFYSCVGKAGDRHWLVFFTCHLHWKGITSPLRSIYPLC